jgi:polyferredoxin/tetratricopeptide (TPR) repeat protein
MGKWRAAVLIGIHVLIGLHIAHWLVAGQTMTPVEPSEAMAFSQSSIVNAGLIFFAVTILATAFFGRFFCGWGCHVVALQDLCRWLMLKVGITPKPLKSRALLFVPALAFVYMFLWPLAYRIYLGDSLAVRGTELETSHFWATFPGWVVGGLTFLICGFACVYFLGAKGFCTYACPYGAIFAAADKVAPMRIRVTDACEGCGHCTAVCTSNVRVHQEVRDFGMVVSPGCMKCGDCISVCPKDALYYGMGPIPWLAAPKSPDKKPVAAVNWREEAILVVAFALSFVIVRGLYGLVPFLMALGTAAVIAFLALTSWRLWRGQDLDRSGFRLMRGGRLLPWGRAFAASMALLALFLVHSAVVQAHTYLGDRAFTATAGPRQELLQASATAAGPSDALRGQAEAGVQHWLAVERWGLFPTYGLEPKLAWLETLRGATEAGEQRARKAIERDQMSAPMHQLLARGALRRGDPAGAVAEWERAIAARPDLPEPYLALGIHLAQGGDVAGGQQAFDRGLAANPHSAQLLYNAALARALLGRPEDSIVLFERALAINPRYREARENLAGVLAGLGRFGESVAHFRQALEQAPDDVATRILLARVLVELGELETAREELRKVRLNDASNEEAAQLLRDLGSPGG